MFMVCLVLVYPPTQLVVTSKATLVIVLVVAVWQVLFLLLQLILRDNDIDSIPLSVDACEKLKTLHLQGNQINVVPPDFGKYTYNVHSEYNK